MEDRFKYRLEDFGPKNEGLGAQMNAVANRVHNLGQQLRQLNIEEGKDNGLMGEARIAA